MVWGNNTIVNERDSFDHIKDALQTTLHLLFDVELEFEVYYSYEFSCPVIFIEFSTAKTVNNQVVFGLFALMGDILNLNVLTERYYPCEHENAYLIALMHGHNEESLTFQWPVFDIEQQTRIKYYFENGNIVEAQRLILKGLENARKTSSEF